ncbi:MAG TPA: hypothetical protein VK176_08425 [Phycisphaerales bacterium]|nr:hypothetical protein [Phycisphaerales bacterium]
MEIDVVARQHFEFETPDQTGYTVEFNCAIECKWSRQSPWILMNKISSRERPGALYHLMGSWDLKRLRPHHRRGLLKGDPVQTFYSSSVSKTDDSKGDDAAYRILRKFSRACELFHKTDSLPDDLYGVLVLPIIVVDGDLFIAYLDSCSQELQLEDCTHGRIIWKHNNRPHAIEICSYKHLPEYCERLKLELEMWRNAIQQSFPRKYP